jgi:hypothetical protein
VLPVHWSVPHSRPFALSLVLSLAHTHIHTRIETGGTHNGGGNVQKTECSVHFLFLQFLTAISDNSVDF